MEDREYSVYSNFVHPAHRHFYENITSSLNNIKVICALGRSKSMEITDETGNISGILDLIKQVERFTDRLASISTRLFERFYRSKEEFHRANLMSIAYTKINLIDRNLLERTCDVRWWSLEQAFYKCIESYEAYKIAYQGLFDAVNEALKVEASEEGGAGDEIPHFTALSLLFNEGDAEEFSIRADQLQQEGRFNSKKHLSLLSSLSGTYGQVKGLCEHACRRLEDINSSYTLYRDLVITDNEGYVIANANVKRRDQVLGVCVAQEQWFTRALKTASADHYYAQDLSESCLEDQLSLIYATAVRANGRSEGAAIGVMGIYFDFQGESSIILDDYMHSNAAGDIADGWYSVTVSRRGHVIASSDTLMFPELEIPHLPRSLRQLVNGDNKAVNANVFGTDSLVARRQTDGYLEYPGHGWVSMVIMPETDTFKRTKLDESELHDAEELLQSRIIPQVNREAFDLMDSTRFRIHHISLNGMISAAKFGRQGESIAPIFDAITKFGSSATDEMEKVLLEMSEDNLQQAMGSLQMLAKQAIDLIDRNLFERAADVRWWATDHFFHDALTEQSQEFYEAASERLHTINRSYTMYRDLVLVDASGHVVANANEDKSLRVLKASVSKQPWYQEAMATECSTEFVVQDAAQNELEPDQEISLIYAGGIRAGGQRQGKAIGALGILFDWDTEARQMLEVSLPRTDDGEILPGSFAVYVTQENLVIESTDVNLVPIGTHLDFGAQLDELDTGETTGDLVTYGRKKYVIGAARTSGYREYRGLRWKAYVFRLFLG